MLQLFPPRFVTQDPETHAELPPYERGRIRSDPKPDPRHFVTVDLADDTDRAIGGWGRHNVELFQRRFVKDLEEAGIRAMLRNDLDDKDNLDSILKRQGWTPEPDISTEYQAWILKQDGSVGVEALTDNEPDPDTQHKGDYEWAGIEMTSPAFRSFYDFRRQLHTVLGILRNNYRTTVNSTCGFHVHVSEDIAGGMSKDTFKKTIGLYLLMENRLMALCHPSRITQAWGAPLIPDSRLFLSEEAEKAPSAVDPQDAEFTRWIPQYPGVNIAPELHLALRRLWFPRNNDDFAYMLYAAPYTPSFPGRQALAEHSKDTVDISDEWSIIKSVSSGGSGGLEASRPNSPASDSTSVTARSTLEWRHQQGTLDFDFIIEWVSLLEFIVYLGQSELPRFQELFKYFIKGYKPVQRGKPDAAGTADLLRDLGCTASGVEYWSERMKRERGPAQSTTYYTPRLDKVDK